MKNPNQLLPDIDPQETQEWLDALEALVKLHGPNRAEYLLSQLITAAQDL